MHQEPDHELPYIKQAKRDDAHEVARDKAVEKLWDDLSTPHTRTCVLEGMDTWDVAIKLVAMIANHRAEEEAARIDYSIPYDKRKSERDSSRISFVNELQTAVEELFIGKEDGNEN